MMSHDVLAAAAAERHQTLMTEAARRRLRREAMEAVAAVDPQGGAADRVRAIARYIRSVEERLEIPVQVGEPARSLTP